MSLDIPANLTPSDSPQLIDKEFDASYTRHMGTINMHNNSQIQINPLNIDTIDLGKLWAHYDDEVDSLVIFLTGKPVRAVSVLLEDDTYVKIDPATGEIVGFHIEAWERQFVPDHPDIQSSWNKISPHTADQPEWSHILHMMALWLVFLFKNDYMTPLAGTPA